MIQYCSVGAAEGIGASAHYLQFDRWGVLLDAGSDPTANGVEALPDYELLEERPVSALALTHAHLDHIGSLPVAIRRFPHARVYMTPATAELTDQLLYHYLQVQRKRGGKDFIPLYDEPFLEAIRYLYQSFDYGQPFPLHSYEDSGLRFTFYDAGHILGSAGVLLEWRGRRVFYTGNTRKSSQFILQGARYPEGPIDLLISEATYGADARAETVRRPDEAKRFARKVRQRLQLGGVVMLPVFALGRTQEMLAMIQHLRLRGHLPSVPVYITGMGLKINKIYDRLLHNIYPDRFDPGALRAMMFGQWRRGQKLHGPAILLATSGMMIPGSPSFDFARTLAADPRNGIYFVGYADPETPAGLFREQQHDRLKALLGVEAIHCQVEVFQFSAHSHRQDLLAMALQLRPRRIIFTHGEAPALEWLAAETRRRLPRSEVILPQQGEWLTLA